MLAIIFILLFSVGILRLYGEKIQALGLFPSGRRIQQFLAGFTFFGVLAVVYYGIFILALEADVKINESYSILEFLESFWWTLKSVLYEELLFRGALLVLAMKFLGKFTGLLLSSIIFGVYHWFSYNGFGDILEMSITFLITGVGGIVFAYGFAITRSLFLPIGLHFGWNLVTIVIFSQGPLGQQLLISTTESTLGGWWSLTSILFQVALVPFCAFILIDRVSDRNIRISHISFT